MDRRSGKGPVRVRKEAEALGENEKASCRSRGDKDSCFVDQRGTQRESEGNMTVLIFKHCTPVLDSSHLSLCPLLGMNPKEG